MFFFSACSSAVLAGQKAGPEMEESSCSHPEHLEEVEGELPEGTQTMFYVSTLILFLMFLSCLLLCSFFSLVRLIQYIF